MNKIFKSIKDFVERSEYADRYPDIFDDEDIFDLEKFENKKRMIEEAERARLIEGRLQKDTLEEDLNLSKSTSLEEEEQEKKKFEDENPFEREFFDESNFHQEEKDIKLDPISQGGISDDSPISLSDIASEKQKPKIDPSMSQVLKDLQGDQALRKVKEAFIYNEILNKRKR